MYWKITYPQQDHYQLRKSVFLYRFSNLTGLRVETVIRTIKKMTADNILKLDGRRILY